MRLVREEVCLGIAAGVLGLGLAVSASAATVCVNPDQKGCEGTIQAGVDAAAAGDTVSVADGEYFENVTIGAGKDGLVLMGQSKNGTILDPDDPNTGVGILVQSAKVTIENLTIRNGQSYGIEIDGVKKTSISRVHMQNVGDSCIYGSGSKMSVSQISLQGCSSNAIDVEGDGSSVTDSSFDQMDQGGIFLSGDDMVVTGNHLEGMIDDNAIDVSGNGAMILDNQIKSVDDYGINLSGDDALIQGNKVSDTTSEAIYVSGDNIQIVNNDLDLVYGGVYVDGDGPRITGNMITGSYYDYPIETTGQNPVIKNNTFKGGYYGIYVNCTTTCSDGLVKANMVEDVYGDETGLDISANAAGLRVIGNTVKRAQDTGIDISGTGIIAKNNVAKNSGGDLGDYGFYVSGTDHTLTGNQSIATTGDGFVISGTGHVLKSNLAKKNIEDGFDIGNSAATGVSLDGNTATKNGGVGFEVDSNATNTDLQNNSGSGNRAGFCDDGTGTTKSNNSFGGTVPDCVIGN